MKKAQQGFSVVEGVLIFAILGLIGFVGWYVWSSKSKADKSLNSSQTFSQNSTTKTDAGYSTAKVVNDYAIIQPWGIKVPVSNGLHIEYEYKRISGSKSRIYFSSKELDGAIGGSGCIGYDIVRGLANDLAPIDAVKQPTFQEAWDGVHGLADNYPTKIGQFFYISAGPHPFCGDGSDKVLKLESAAHDAIYNSVINMVAE